MKFFESQHCKSNKHCLKCRAIEQGREWRHRLRKAFADLTSDDFECPEGKAFSSKPLEAKPIKPNRDALARYVKDLPDTKAGKWSKAMITQCYHIMMHPPKGITCKTKRAFRSRCTRKIEYYSGLCANE